MDNISAASTTLGLVLGAIKIMTTSFKRRQTVGLLLPLGCGKTTLVHTLNNKYRKNKVLFVDLDPSIEGDVSSHPAQNPLASLKKETQEVVVETEEGEVHEDDIQLYPAVRARIREMRANFKGYKIVLVTSSVPLLDYCKVFTRIVCCPNLRTLGETLLNVHGRTKWMRMIEELFDLTYTRPQGVIEYDSFEKLYEEVGRRVIR